MDISLPSADGSVERYALTGVPVDPVANPRFSRVAYAAAHVVADPLAMTNPWSKPEIDWERTMAFRHHLWRLGFRIAEAMDTAQRGMGLDWSSARELIRRSITEARTVEGADLASGAGTDQLAPQAARSLDDVVAAYEEQFAFIEGLGGKPIMMASRALARVARGADDYSRVYDRILEQASGKVILHWLGDMFDPALRGYWGSETFEDALDTVVGIIERHAAKVEGIKISLLDAGKERALRERLPEGVLMFTGDDFNYPELIAGDDHGFSHALLGVFDPLGPLAAEAVRRLDTGDTGGFHALLDPTVELARHLFQAPTRSYKTGVVFLAWLAGHQSHFTLLGGLQSARSLPHLARAYELADRLGLFPDPRLAEARMRTLLTLYGVTP